MTSGPFFSVLISAYNRADHIALCVRSAIGQTFADFEVVVVDDASTDGTPDVLDTLALEDHRLRVVRHDRNRGISPARATAVEQARGEWLVIVDSDWELCPDALTHLRGVIDRLPDDIHIIRSRLRCDDGSLQPAIMPVEITGYRERLQWMEEVAVHGGSSDAGHCMHRSVLASTNYFVDRRGAMELLWETDLARRESSLWVTDVLGVQHTDAPNSHSRDRQVGRVIDRLLREAPDALWMAETMLAEHGNELAAYAPHVRLSVIEGAATQAFLTGERRRGMRHLRTAMQSGASSPKPWVTLGLGLVGPRALAWAKVAGRRRQAVPAAAMTPSAA